MPPLPQRPTLDALVHDAELGLVFDDRLGVYRGSGAGRTATGVDTRKPTSLPAGTSPVGDAGAVGARLDTSIRSRSFLALGVRADRLDRFISVGEHQYGATVVDVTDVLLGTLRAAAADAGVPWEMVRAGDAEDTNSRGRRGLAELVRRSWGAVERTIERAMADGDDGPVLLTETSPLARYGNVALLAQWSDLGAPRPRAIWVLVPQLGANHGPLIDGQPVPLAAPSQYVALDNDWVDAAAVALTGPKES